MTGPQTVRTSVTRVLRRAGRTGVGQRVAQTRVGGRIADALRPADGVWPAARPGSVSAVDAVEFGHRIILGRPPSPDLRASLLADLEAGRTTPAQAWAGLASSPEFAGRVEHQRAVVDAQRPVDDPDLVRVEDLIGKQSIEEHNASAESYYAGRDPSTIEQMLAKPYATPAEATELLTCFGHLVGGLELVPGDRLLDFGVGTGWTSWMFAQLGAEVVLADVAPSALAVARQRFERWPLVKGRVQPSYVVFDGHRLDVDDASIDKICCFDAFHHLVNQAEVMAEFARVLRPGGLVGFDEPGPYHSRTPQAQYEMATYGVIEGDIELPTMAAMARDAGLEFVAADVMTTQPVWVPLERFTDLLANQVVDADASARIAVQGLTKQQFILRKPGGSGPDSRMIQALGARLTLRDARVERTDDGAIVRVRLEVANTGTGRWLEHAAGTGGVTLGVRSSNRPGWETRLRLAAALPVAPGASVTVDGEFDVPADLFGDTALVNLVSENIAWFDLVGTPAVQIAISP